MEEASAAAKVAEPVARIPSEFVVRVELEVEQARDRYGFVFRPLSRHLQHEGVQWQSQLETVKDTESRGGEQYALYKYQA